MDADRPCHRLPPTVDSAPSVRRPVIKGKQRQFPSSWSFVSPTPIVFLVSVILFILLLFQISSHSDLFAQAQAPTGLPAPTELKFKEGVDPDKKLDQCATCRVLVDSFEAGLKRTERGKFEGGDTHWEEKNGMKYLDSEIRLVEIEESLCNDSPTASKDQCLHFLEENEPHLESWWFGDRKKGVALFTSLCEKNVQVCCPADHFGRECSPCPGFPGEICSGRGTCSGAGTTAGSGKCNCAKAYGGEFCDRCAADHFEQVLEQEQEGEKSKVTCTPCDKSCDGPCHGPGPKACKVCRKGWEWDAEHGCLDINECIESVRPPCRSNSFCVNSAGSYYCYKCDKACDGCDGDGPDNCLKCATGHHLDGGQCVDEESDKMERNMTWTRYATYLGLSSTALIILRRNLIVASIVGIVVAIYIGVAEYTFNERLFDPMLKYFSNS